MKYIKISERCGWERETWNFHLIKEIQDEKVLEKLKTFLEQLTSDNKDTKRNHKYALCAVSFYEYSEIDEVSNSDNTGYISENSLFEGKIDEKKLDDMIKQYTNSKKDDKYDPFYKGGIGEIF